MPRPAPAAQATFPFACGAPPSPVACEPIGRAAPPALRTRLALGGRSLVLALARSRDGARLSLEAQLDGPGAWAIALELRTRPILTATIQSDAPDPLHWALSARTPGGDPREFFAYALRWGTRKLTGATRSRGRALAVEAGLRPALLEAAARMAAALPPDVAALARRFAPPVRTRVAAAVSRDRGGWLASTARAHPGPLLFGLGLLDAEETEEAGLTLLHDLGQGRRLGPAVDAAVAAWAAALPVWAEQADLWSPVARGAFEAAAAAAPAEAARLAAAQRLLVRRAGPRCAPALLLLPPPARFAPEDVPAAPRENAAWFRVMKVPGLTLPTAEGPDADEAFAAFASRHAVTLARVPRGVALETWLGELDSLLRAAGRTPSRATDPARLIRRIDVRELRARRPDGVAPAVQLVRQGDRDQARPSTSAPLRGAYARDERNAQDAPAPAASLSVTPHRFAPWSSARASVVQLRTLHELRAEAFRQRNCVDTYRERLEAGGVVVFSARVDGAPLTVAIAPTGRGGWAVSEWKGFRNRALTGAEIAALAPWREALGIGYRPRR